MEPNPHAEGAQSAGAQISDGAAQLVAEYTGHGPTKARTIVSDDLVTIVMGGSLSTGEQTLIEEGDGGGLVLEVRRRFQQAMREKLIALVEDRTGRKVIAFMSDQHLDPDLATQIFILEPHS